MIERIVLVKLNDELSTAAGRIEVARHSASVLAEVPGVLEVATSVAGDDSTAEDWDVCLRLRFAELDRVESYRVHPRHRDYVDRYLKPRMAAIRAWNFKDGAGR
jgi:hypothetical protein